MVHVVCGGVVPSVGGGKGVRMRCASCDSVRKGCASCEGVWGASGDSEGSSMDSIG